MVLMFRARVWAGLEEIMASLRGTKPQAFSTANSADDLFIMPGPLRTKTENESC